MEQGQRKELERAIIDWIKTFPEVQTKPETFESLFDGIVLAEIMNKIAPHIFDLSKINYEAGSVWQFTSKNLTYLYDGIEDFYVNEILKPFDKSYVDIMEIAKNGDRQNVYNLVEYVLGAVVQCDQKDQLVSVLIQLDEQAQTELMDVIDKIIAKCTPKQGVPDPLNGSLLLNSSMDQKSSPKHPASFIKSENKDKLILKLDEMDNENQQLRNRLDDTSDERDKLKQKVTDLHLELTKKSEEIKYLNTYKEQAMKQLSSQELTEDLQNELKFKDKKITETQKLMEDMRNQYELKLNKTNDEIDNYKKKLSQLSKLEVTLEFYKQKYEDCQRLTEKCTELETQQELTQTKIAELEDENEAFKTKVKKYQDQFTAEKDKNINLDLTITKRDAEIEALKNDKKRLEVSFTESETRINDMTRQLEALRHEREDTARIHVSTERAMAQIAQSGYDNLKPKGMQSQQMVEAESDKEFLEKEIEILKAKCKDLQKDNELLKIRNDKLEAETPKLVEKVTKENEGLKEEVVRIKSGLTQTAAANSEQHSVEINKYREEVSLLRDRLNNTKETSSENTNEEVRKLQDQLETHKEEYDEQKKIVSTLSLKVSDLNREVETQRQIFNELDDQKEEELRVISSAFHELAMRNYDLEKKLASVMGADSKVKNTNTSPASGLQQAQKLKK
jgi:chromosome segregation ATPase